MALHLEQFIPLPQAAKRLKISATSLQGLIDDGRIKAVKLNGTVAVAKSELDQFITREQFHHLRGQPISVSEAVETYGITSVTIRNWVKRGYIKVLKEGYGMEVDLADMAYCAAVYESHGGAQGKRIFDELGQPYQMKHSEWAIYQRERRKRKPTRDRRALLEAK
jgi:excisionase family DNA binding protein